MTGKDRCIDCDEKFTLFVITHQEMVRDFTAAGIRPIQLPFDLSVYSQVSRCVQEKLCRWCRRLRVMAGKDRCLDCDEKFTLFVITHQEMVRDFTAAGIRPIQLPFDLSAFDDRSV